MTAWHLTPSTIWPHDLIDSKISLNHEPWQDIIEPSIDHGSSSSSNHWTKISLNQLLIMTHHWTSRDTTSLMILLSYDIIESRHHRFTSNGATDSRQHFLFKTYRCVFGQNLQENLNFYQPSNGEINMSARQTIHQRKIRNVCETTWKQVVNFWRNVPKTQWSFRGCD